MPERKKPYTVAGQRVTHEEYVKTRYEDLRVRVPKGHKQLIQEYVKASNNKSMNQFIYDSMMEKIKRDDENAYSIIQKKIAEL